MQKNIIYNESCMVTVKKIPDNSIDCVITSPPYWQLRDYGYTGQWGLEPDFNDYLKNLWGLMDEVYRILKPTGTAWVNLGDTYGGNNSRASNNGRAGFGTEREAVVTRGISKCLMLIPHRFAIGCIDRGWIMRNDCIWAKRNGMPDSVKDRFTKKHEYFFFMVKSENYFFDLDIIRDKHKWAQKDKRADGKRHEIRGLSESGQYATTAVCYNEKGKNPGDVSDFWDITTKGSKTKHFASYNDELMIKPILAGCPEGGVIYDPFIGSGSTAEAAIRANRNFIGSEMSAEYCEIANKRLNKFLTQTKLL